MGFILYQKSKRYVNVDQLAQLTEMVPEHIARVAVVVNPSKTLLSSIVNQTTISTIQFHGNESPEFIQSFQQQYPHMICTKALPASEDLTTQIQRYRDIVAYFVIDTPSAAYGGTGERFDWRYLDAVPNDVRILVAGGIDEIAIRELQQSGRQIYGYDLASKIEENGRKSREKMCAVVHAVKKG